MRHPLIETSPIAEFYHSTGPTVASLCHDHRVVAYRIQYIMFHLFSSRFSPSPSDDFQADYLRMCIIPHTDIQTNSIQPQSQLLTIIILLSSYRISLHSACIYNLTCIVRLMCIYHLSRFIGWLYG